MQFQRQELKHIVKNGVCSAVPRAACRVCSAPSRVSSIPAVSSGCLLIMEKPFHMYIISWNRQHNQSPYLLTVNDISNFSLEEVRNRNKVSRMQNVPVWELAIIFCWLRNWPELCKINMVTFDDICRMGYFEDVKVPYKHRNRKRYGGAGSVASGFADSKFLCRRRLPCYLLFEGWHLPGSERQRETDKKERMLLCKRKT